MRFFGVILIGSLLSTVAFASNTEEARAHYEKATAHFAVGEFADAAVEYQAAFKAKPDPALLYNAAQSYRLANNPDKALILYRNYVQLYPTAQNVDEVRSQIEKLKDAIAAAEKAKNAPPTGTNEPTHIRPVPPETAPAVETQSTHAQTSETPTKPAASDDRSNHASPVYKKWWLWTAVGVVVAGGVVAAVVLSTQSSGTWSNAPDIGPGSKNGLTVAAVQW